ncbi:MAG: hypothetical protein WAU07_02870 [Microgenomates group bacterium]
MDEELRRPPESATQPVDPQKARAEAKQIAEARDLIYGKDGIERYNQLLDNLGQELLDILEKKAQSEAIPYRELEKIIEQLAFAVTNFLVSAKHVSSLEVDNFKSHPSRNFPEKTQQLLHFIENATSTLEVQAVRAIALLREYFQEVRPLLFVVDANHSEASKSQPGSTIDAVGIVNTRQAELTSLFLQLQNWIAAYNKDNKTKINGATNELRQGVASEVCNWALSALVQYRKDHAKLQVTEMSGIRLAEIARLLYRINRATQLLDSTINYQVATRQPLQKQLLELQDEVLENKNLKPEAIDAWLHQLLDAHLTTPNTILELSDQIIRISQILKQEITIKFEHPIAIEHGITELLATRLLDLLQNSPLGSQVVDFYKKNMSLKDFVALSEMSHRAVFGAHADPNSQRFIEYSILGDGWMQRNHREYENDPKNQDRWLLEQQEKFTQNFEHITGAVLAFCQHESRAFPYEQINVLHDALALLPLKQDAKQTLRLQLEQFKNDLDAIITETTTQYLHKIAERSPLNPKERADLDEYNFDVLTLLGEKGINVAEQTQLVFELIDESNLHEIENDLTYLEKKTDKELKANKHWVEQLGRKIRSDFYQQDGNSDRRAALEKRVEHLQLQVTST